MEESNKNIESISFRENCCGTGFPYLRVKTMKNSPPKFTRITLAFILIIIFIVLVVALSRQSFFQQLFVESNKDDLLFLNVPTYQAGTEGPDIGNIGTFAAWEKVELNLTGPSVNGLDTQINPFTILVDIHFVSPSGKTFVVPAFYNGNGSGNMTGNKWKGHFSTGTVGEWTFSTVSLDPLLNGIKGHFTIIPSPSCEMYTKGEMPDFSCTGRLEYVGGHYLRFANNDYWIKGGIDDPENFIGDAFGDWSAKKEAIDFLSQKGVNSIYVITNNIDGDRKDTWPWLGDTQNEAKANSSRFNLAKLQAWDEFFTYVQEKGIVLHIVLNDDSAWNGYDHGLYYREMVARFGHHPALIWNIGEEANEIYSDQRQIALAKALQELDPYNHPITVHRKSDWPFLGNTNFDLTSIQIGNGANDFSTVELPDYYQIVTDHRESSIDAGHPIPVMVDEIPLVTSVDQNSRRKMRTEVLYPIYFAGGNFEMHYYDIYGQGGTVSIQDLNPILDDMYHARAFMENLPFYEMQPCKSSLLDGSDQYCLEKPGIVYALYIPKGGSFNLDLTKLDGYFRMQWINPRLGETVTTDYMIGGKSYDLISPDDEDWALRINLIYSKKFHFFFLLISVFHHNRIINNDRK